MPPRRPPTDLDLISVFKMLTPNEQLVASKMSPRCAVLVRAANRTVKTLVITALNNGKSHNLKYRINSFSLASKTSIQQLKAIPGETFPDYPMTTRLSKWNCLMIQSNGFCWFDAETIEQIVTVFSAVTELKFMTISSKHLNTLVSLLQHPNWKCQLTNLMVDGSYEIENPLASELITAINNLTALQLLALNWFTDTEVPDLSVLAQLKTVVFESDNSNAFLRSLERNAADNAHLEVHLLSRDSKALLSLSQPLRSRIVRYQLSLLHYTIDQVPLFCSQFRSLTSLALWPIKPPEVGQLFSGLSQLHQLIHLKFGVDFSEVKEDELPLPARPLVQLNSLRAVDLRLLITSHSQIEWLNLPGTMPNLKTIHSDFFSCDSCKVKFDGIRGESSLLSSPPGLGCFRSSLFNLHPGVSLKRFILSSNYEFKSAEELLLQSQ